MKSIIYACRCFGSSARLCCRPFLGLLGSLSLLASAGLAQDMHIAYQVPTNTVGNQAFDGVLGMEFEVINPIIVTRLGAFDDGGNGMNRPITVRLYDRADEENPVEIAQLIFSTEEPGDLIGGSRFKALAAALNLPVGFKGTISAENYGAEEQLRNAGFEGGTAGNWTLNDGNGSLQFVGLSRYGTTQGAYPNVVDAGPAARYAAGTFEFRSTPALKPGKPTGVAVSASDGQILLRWQAVTNPLPAVKYQVYRAQTLDGPSNQVAEVTTLEYQDKGLNNGQIYSYYIRGIGANNSQGDFSARFNAAPYVLPSDQIVAYFVPPSLIGSQAFDGVLGMDFNVWNPIVITRLGVFDDGTDGLKRNITARIYNRADPANPVEMATLEFTVEEPGTLIGGSRYKDLASPLLLDIGFKGTITAENYGAEEKLLNSGGNTNQTVWTLNDGDSSIAFVGTSRYGVVQGAYADSPDGGPAARYAAGSFIYRTTAPQVPGATTLSAALADRAVKLTWTPVNKPLPAVAYRVYKIDAAGTATKVTEVAATEFIHTGLTKGERASYWVRAVAANGKESVESNTESVTVEAREAGIAYLVEGNTPGSQAFGGNMGMDFDVVTPIKITRLGVFDDSSDGLALAIKARLYDRATTQELAMIEFTPESSGELIGGSRFKNLTPALVLPAGFKGTISAAGYGDIERLGNGVPGRSVFSAVGVIRFVGTARYAVDPEKYPDTADGGPANRYAAGTFYFEPLAEQPKLSIKLENGKVTLTWTGTGTLQMASQVTGSWNDVSGATSGMEVPVSGSNVFYRIKM